MLLFSDFTVKMQSIRLTDQFKTLFRMATQMVDTVSADAVLLLVKGPTDWARIARMTKGVKLLVVGDKAAHIEGAVERKLTSVLLDTTASSVYEQLSQTLLKAVAEDLLPARATVVALYSSFETTLIDSMSIIRLGEHLNRLTGQDLRRLETRVPLETLKLVTDLAIEIGRDGREGIAVGTMFVVGDTRSVMSHSRSAGFDPVKGYTRKERNLTDPRVREGIKEIAGLDGAIVISNNCTVEATCRYLDAPASNLTLSKGLGARHWAAAAISRATNAVAVTVSHSNGTVRIFQNGEVMLRIEPSHRRPMVWREFEYEPPSPE
jgi:diadenylate cyclase